MMVLATAQLGGKINHANVGIFQPNYAIVNTIIHLLFHCLLLLGSLLQLMIFSNYIMYCRLIVDNIFNEFYFALFIM